MANSAPMAAAKKPKQKQTAPAELARAGKIDALYERAFVKYAPGAKKSKKPSDRDAYKWLNAALDFGHKKAGPAIDDIMEVTDLRYDDDGYEVAAAHWELAAAYLEGADGLPLDLKLAKKHLAEAFRTFDLGDIRAGTLEKYDAKPLLARLTGPAKKLLEGAMKR